MVLIKFVKQMVCIGEHNGDIPFVLKPATISSPEFVGVECSCPEMGWEVVLIKL